MIITPIAVIGWVIAGGASAFGGWVFHKFVKLRGVVNDVSLRVEKLEK